MGLRFAGFFDDRARSSDRTANLPTEGSIGDLVQLARANSIDIVYVALPLRAELRIRDLLRRMSDTTVTIHYVPDFSLFDALHARWPAKAYGPSGERKESCKKNHRSERGGGV